MKKRNIRLLIAVGALAVVYLLLRPTLNGILSDAKRIDSETDRMLTGGHEQKPLDDKIAAIQQQISNRPGNPALVLQLAGAYKEAGRMAEAIKTAEEAGARFPDHPEPLLALGDLHHVSKRLDLAIDAYRKCLSKYPGQPIASASLGWLYISLGWTREAQALLRAAHNAHPVDSSLAAALALADMQASDPKEAEKLLLEVKQREPNMADLWGPLIDLYIKIKSPDKAIAIAEAALLLKPNDLKMLNGIAQAQYDQRNYAAAIATCERVVGLAKDNLFAHYRLALCAKAQNRPADAQREFELVYALQPSYEQCELLLGQIYLRNGNAARGQQLLKSYQERLTISQEQAHLGYLLFAKSELATSHLKMSRVYRIQKDFSREIVELKRTLEIEPGNAEARQRLASAISEFETTSAKR